MATQIRHTETVDEARVRLARDARQQGVTLTVEDGRYFASSVSTPGKRYLVTGFSCEATGAGIFSPDDGHVAPPRTHSTSKSMSACCSLARPRGIFG